jgi:hypothetical protein
MRSTASTFLTAGLALLSATGARAACPANPLEMHAAFFDVDGDGKVEYHETVSSVRTLGATAFEATRFAVILHTAVFFKNGGHSTAITVAGIARTGRHEGDSGIWDASGAYDQAAFDRFFGRFDADRSGALTKSEIETAMAANKRERGSNGAAAAGFELPVLVHLAGDRTENGGGSPVKAISRERLQAFYQGTLFYTLAGKALPSCAPVAVHSPRPLSLERMVKALGVSASPRWDQGR